MTTSVQVLLVDFFMADQLTSQVNILKPKTQFGNCVIGTDCFFLFVDSSAEAHGIHSLLLPGSKFQNASL